MVLINHYRFTLISVNLLLLLLAGVFAAPADEIDHRGKLGVPPPVDTNDDMNVIDHRGKLGVPPPVDTNDDMDDVDFSGKLGRDLRETKGDMVMLPPPPRVQRSIRIKRNVERNENLRWAGAEVPFNYTEAFTDEDKVIIRQAMDEIESNSCVKFRLRTTDDFDYLLIQDMEDKSGCFAAVGFTYFGAQPCNLDHRQYCVYFKGVVHELMHSLGFQHMQCNFNRDDYIKINFENIQEGAEYNFVKLSEEQVTDYGLPYDYNSVTHYDGTAFSKNGLETMVPIVPGAVIYNDGHLSESDKIKLNKMYHCNEV